MKTLAALVTAGFLTLFSISAPKVEAPVVIEKVPDRHDVRAWAKRLSPQLKKIGLKSTIDDIECGGVGVWNGKEMLIYELENEVRDDERKFKNFTEGDNKEYGHLTGHVNLAAHTSAECTPEYSTHFYCIAQQVNFKLLLMLHKPREQREKIAKDAWIFYDTLVLHNMYVKDSEHYDKLKEKYKNVVFSFHTHQNGSPGSRVDKRLSHDRIELVIASTKDSYKLYYLDKGNEELIDGDDSLMAKD